MTYIFAKRVIDKGTYGNKEEFQLKLDVFLMGGRITQEQYKELSTLLGGE